MPRSLYIHIPFCRKKFAYCDFYSIGYQNRLARSFIDALSSRISRLDQDFSTIYIGGGTPSVLSLDNLKRLLMSLWPISRAVSEFTAEVNPESVDKKRLKLFRDNGVNRISIGVQSFSDQKLKSLGRVHSAKQAKQAICLAKESGIQNISIDLIFGLSGQTLADWKKELECAVSLDVKHISTYCLTYEKDTPLFLAVKRKFIVPLKDRVLAKMYGDAVSYLSGIGFLHYEISNFAKPGFESKHNQNYWNGGSYLGLGPSAVSFDGATREKNVEDVERYILCLNKKKSPVIFRESLSKKRRARELAAIKIRTKEGIDFDWFKKKTGFDFLALAAGRIDNLKNSGLVKYQKKKGQNIDIRLTNKGFLFADSVSSELV